MKLTVELLISNTLNCLHKIFEYLELLISNRLDYLHQLFDYPGYSTLLKCKEMIKIDTGHSQDNINHAVNT